MKSTLLIFGLFLAGAGLASAGNTACSAAPINDPTMQAGSPPGCTQVDMQFSLIEQVMNLTIDTADASSAPADSTVAVIGAGGAFGTGASSQMLQFYQIGQNFQATDNTGIGGQQFAFTATFGVTDINAFSSITGVYLAMNNMTLQNQATLNGITETVCTGTTTFAGCSPVTTIDPTFFLNSHGGGDYANDVAIAGAQLAAIQFSLDVELSQNGDSFGLPGFFLGFDETLVGAPEPSTFVLLGTSLAGLAYLRARGKR